jgi:MOSC domain-containing protein YiiM
MSEQSLRVVVSPVKINHLPLPFCFFGQKSTGTMKTKMTILLLCVEVTIVLGFSGQTDCASRRPGTKDFFSLLLSSLFPQNPVNVAGDWMERYTAAKHEVALTNSAVFFDFSNRKKKGVVMRTAARNFDSEGSNKPSSRNYTTSKDSQPSVSITAQGIAGDYNHYRTQALSSTPDRAVSLLTSDAAMYVKRMYPFSSPGDLGENILVDGVEYWTIKVGARYQLGEKVVLEITEPIEPCANLCKLPYINNDTLAPKDRIERCRNFIEQLDAHDGLRGWYAKVTTPGNVVVGDTFQLL